MQTRTPIVAGQFYPVQHDSCVSEINEYIDQITTSESLPDIITAGIVPHAGWTFSAKLAVMVFEAIRSRHEKVNTFIIFGAAHSHFDPMPAVYNRGSWDTPLGEVAIDEDLADAVRNTGHAVSDIDAHSAEHSIEVQIPIIQHIFPGARILPIIVPPTKQSISLGTAVGDIIAAEKSKKIVCIGSTDLTHYGPRYGFVPMGTGAEAIKWASEVNDKDFIDLALTMKPDELLVSSTQKYNACGPGAAAATVAAAKKLNVKKGILLEHTDSNKIMIEKMNSSSAESVGYAAIVF